MSLTRWLKGGLIGVLVAIILMSTGLLGLFNISFGYFNLMDDSSSNLFFVFFDSQCRFLIQCEYEGCMDCIFLIPLIVLIEFFILGYLLGLIYEKLKSKENSKKLVRLFWIIFFIVIFLLFVLFVIYSLKEPKILEEKNLENKALINLAKERQDISICNRIKNSISLYECISYFARLKNDSSLCNPIIDENLRYACKSSVIYN